MTNQERAYIETEYSCAYCGIKDKKSLTIDHIDGRKNKNSLSYDNLIVLCHNCHYQKTNKKIEIEEIKKIKKVLLYKTLTVFGINALKMASRNEYGVAATPFLLMHMVEMGMLKKEETICEEIELGTESGKLLNKIVSEARFIITEEGERIYKKWFKSR